MTTVPRAAILAVVAAVAAAVPLALHLIVAARLRDHALPALSQALGQPVAIDDVEAGLTGTVTLTGVRVGERLAAGSVEAAVGLSHLLAGELVPDEIRVSQPRLRARFVDGRLDAGFPTARVRRAAPQGDGATPTRRIVLAGGELVLDLGEHGEIRAGAVELHPQEGGVRVVAGASSAELRHGPWRARVDFARAGLDVELPALRVTRAALDGGTLSLGSGGETLDVDELVVVAGASQRITGNLRGGGRLAVTVDGNAARFEAEGLPLAPLAAALPAWIEPAGRVSGTATLGRGAAPTFEVDLTARGARLMHPLLFGSPLPFDGRVEARGAWDRTARAGAGRLRLAVDRLTLDADVELTLDPGGALLGAALHMALPVTACADVLAALPRPLAAPLIGLDLAGELGGRVDVAFDLARPDEARLDVDLAIGCRILRDESEAQVARLDGPYVHVLPDGRERTLAVVDPDFVPLSQLPRHVSGAFVAAEDARFFQHDGFDEEQVRRSFTIDVAAKRVERGGSTISQQLVKNLFLSRERTLGRKLVEAALTWSLEQRIDKRRILEAYLNVIELGDGVYGIGPAARRWFGKPARRLTATEAAFLAAITSAPRTAEAHIGRAGRLDARFLERTEIVLAAMRRASLVRAADFRDQRASLSSLKLRAL